MENFLRSICGHLYYELEWRYRELKWNYNFHECKWLEKALNPIEMLINKLDENKLTSKICDDCCSFYKKHKEDHSDIEAIKAEWYGIFSDVCWYLGINKRSSKELWLQMCEGNWTHLHLTEEEKKLTDDEWFNDFNAEVLYCSDRWSVDRLMRCHWMFRQWGRKASDGWFKMAVT